MLIHEEGSCYCLNIIAFTVRLVSSLFFRKQDKKKFLTSIISILQVSSLYVQSFPFLLLWWKVFRKVLFIFAFYIEFVLRKMYSSIMDTS